MRAAFATGMRRIEIAGSALPAPLLSYQPGLGLWRLEEAYSIDGLGTHLRIDAPFEFDLASIPRPLWFLISPFDLSIVAPLVHDFLYLNAGEPPPGCANPPRTFRRAEADDWFRQLMRREGVAGWRRVLAYAAVRVFAGPYWGTDLGVRPPRRNS